MLRTPKWEAVASGLANGLTQVDAYIQAGYSPRGARASASRLLAAQPAISIRASEIKAARTAQVDRMVMHNKAASTQRSLITKDYVLGMLQDVAERCVQAQPVVDRSGNATGEYKFDSAGAVAALRLLGSEVGMFTNKVESGPPGAFKNVDEETDARKRIRDRLFRLGMVEGKGRKSLTDKTKGHTVEISTPDSVVQSEGTVEISTLGLTGRSPVTIEVHRSEEHAPIQPDTRVAIEVDPEVELRHDEGRDRT